jgi:hypothetical protein
MRYNPIFNRKLLAIATLLFAIACGQSDKKHESVEIISSPGKQDSIFNGLLTITGNNIPANELSDSLTFLVLPVQASCPACRKKTIDSILKHKNNLLKGRYIIISASGGRKRIGSFFKEQGAEIPDMKNRLILDSINQAYRFSLYEKNPAIYFTYNKKAYKKIIAIPTTVKDDLREFFSGFRKKTITN